MKYWRKTVLSGVACAALVSVPVTSQVFVSAHDGKQVRAGDLLTGPFPDEVVTLGLDGSGMPQVIGRVAAPTTMNGPPVSVAVTRNGRLALVASSQRAGADGKLVPHGIVSAIDLSDATRPRLTGQLALPPGTMGIGLLPDGKRALVASASDESVSLVAIRPDGSLARLQTLKLEAGSEPRDVVIARDGRSAYVVRFGDGMLTRLAIDKDGLQRRGDIAVGKNPDGGVISRDGRFLYNSNFGGTSFSGPAGAISAVDLGRGEMVAGLEVGPVPEHVALSPDGKYLAVVLGNGSAFTRTAANFTDVTGRLKILRADGAKLVPVAEAPIGHNCQGAAFSDDGRSIMVQCAVEKTISAFRFDGKALTPLEKVLSFDARPAAIATPKSR